jgi:hypothetical protein
MKKEYKNSILPILIILLCILGIIFYYRTVEGFEVDTTPQVINSTVGGSTQFGNYYLGEPVVFNYLGRVEGQPGGSGAPLRNRF